MERKVAAVCLIVLTGVLVFRQLKEEKRDEEYHKKRLVLFEVETNLLKTDKTEKTGKVLRITPKDEENGNGNSDKSE